jgi:hypothetical protein
MAASQVRLLLTHAPMPPLLLSIFVLAGAVELSMTSGNRMPLSPAIPQHATPLSITPLLRRSIRLPHGMLLSIRLKLTCSILRPQPSLQRPVPSFSHCTEHEAANSRAAV